MKKVYIVAVLMLQGLRKKPFEANDEVTAENFPKGQFEVLIEKGFIKEKDAEVTASVKNEAVVPPVVTPEEEAEAAAAKVSEEGKGRKK